MKNLKADQTRHYVYALLDPRKPGPFRYGRFVFEFEPFYIGKGRAGRARDHIRMALSNPNNSTLKDRKIRNIVGYLGSEPPIKYLKTELLEDAAYELERSMIRKIGRIQLKTGPLTNRCEGGAGACSAIWSKTALKKRSMFWENLSQDERELRSARISELRKQMHSRVTPEERLAWNESLRAEHASRTQEQKATVAKKISKIITAQHVASSPEQKALRAAAIRAGMIGDPVKRQRYRAGTLIRARLRGTGLCQSKRCDIDQFLTKFKFDGTDQAYRKFEVKARTFVSQLILGH